MNLPISFELDSEWLLRNGHVAPESVDNEKTPEWGIRIKGEFLETRQGEKDFLLISRLPNWSGAQPHQKFDELNVVVTLGGCSGAGTSSVVKLPKSGDLLRRLDELTEKYHFWQAVVRIDNIKSGFHPIKKEYRFQATSLPSEFLAAEPVNWN